MSTSGPLGYNEKMVLACSRNVSGTLSLISSLLILNNIYRCCYAKAIRRSSSNDSNNVTTAAADAAMIPGTDPAVVAASRPEFTSGNDTVIPTTTTTGRNNVAAISALTTSANNNITSTSRTTGGSTTTTSYKGCWSQWQHIWSYTTVYQRLLIGTSVLDILHSFWAALSTLPVPASSGVVFGFGTVTTCTMQGFFIQSSAATPVYFASLTIYFMCKVCYNTSDETLRRNYELWFHLLPILIGFGGGTAGVVLKIFNPIVLPELGCWVSPYPTGCSLTNTCTRGYKIAQNRDLYAWCLSYIWLFLAFFVVVINTTLIYRTIYNRERYGPTYTRARIIQQQNHQQRQQRDSHPIQDSQNQQQQRTHTAFASSDESPGNTISTNHHTGSYLRNRNSTTQSENVFVDTNYNSGSNNNNNTDFVSIREGSDDDDDKNSNNNTNSKNDTVNSNQVLEYNDELEQHEHDDKNKSNTDDNYLNQDNEMNQVIDIYDNNEAMHFDTEFIEDISLPSTHQDEDTTNQLVANDTLSTPTTVIQEQPHQHRYHSSSSRRGVVRDTINNSTATYMNDNSMVASSNGSLLYRRRQQQQHRTNVRTSRIAAVQCVLYVSTALFTAAWSVLPWIGKKLGVSSQWRFFFAFMLNMFYPLQGFFTLIIFIRLKYLRLRISEPNWSRLQCVRYCLFSPDAK